MPNCKEVPDVAAQLGKDEQPEYQNLRDSALLGADALSTVSPVDDGGADDADAMNDSESTSTTAETATPHQEESKSDDDKDDVEDGADRPVTPPPYENAADVLQQQQSPKGNKAETPVEATSLEDTESQQPAKPEEKQPLGIKPKSLAIGDEVTEGPLGQEWRKGVMWKQDVANPRVIVKTNKRDVRILEGEIEFLKFVLEYPHVNVRNMLGVVYETPLQCVLEDCSLGDLLTVLQQERQSEKAPTTKTLFDRAHQIAQGMRHITITLSLVHNNLCAKSIFLDAEGCLKIGDWGVRTTETHACDMLDPRWRAPETLDRGVTNAKTDVWSFGIVLWEIFTLGKTPFEEFGGFECIDLESFALHLKKNNQPPQDHICPGAYEMMQGCWHLVGARRKDFAALCNELEAAVKKHSITRVQALMDMVGGRFLRAKPKRSRAATTSGPSKPKADSAEPERRTTGLPADGHKERAAQPQPSTPDEEAPPRPPPFQQEESAMKGSLGRWVQKQINKHKQGAEAKRRKKRDLEEARNSILEDERIAAEREESRKHSLPARPVPPAHSPQPPSEPVAEELYDQLYEIVDDPPRDRKQRPAGSDGSHSESLYGDQTGEQPEDGSPVYEEEDVDAAAQEDVEATLLALNLMEAAADDAMIHEEHAAEAQDGVEAATSAAINTTDVVDDAEQEGQITAAAAALTTPSEQDGGAADGGAAEAALFDYMNTPRRQSATRRKKSSQRPPMPLPQQGRQPAPPVRPAADAAPSPMQGFDENIYEQESPPPPELPPRNPDLLQQEAARRQSLAADRMTATVHNQFCGSSRRQGRQYPSCRDLPAPEEPRNQIYEPYSS